MPQIPIEGFTGIYQISKEKLTQKKKLEYWVKSKNCLSEINLTLIKKKTNSLHMQTYSDNTVYYPFHMLESSTMKDQHYLKKNHFCVNMTFHLSKVQENRYSVLETSRINRQLLWKGICSELSKLQMCILPDAVRSPLGICILSILAMREITMYTIIHCSTCLSKD